MNTNQPLEMWEDYPRRTYQLIQIRCKWNWLIVQAGGVYDSSENLFAVPSRFTAILEERKLAASEATVKTGAAK